VIHKLNRVSGLLVVFLAAGAAACSKSNPAQPSSGGGSSNTDTTASVTVPQPVSPALNALVRNVDQPVTLVVRNAVITQNAPVTYTFEVATDSAFANKAFSRSGVPENSAGQTSLTIDRIGAGADYFWRARAEGGGTIGPFSAARRMTIGPAVTLTAPTAVSPIGGAGTDARPTFIVANAQKTGPAGPVTYRFEIATDPGFASIALSITVPEGAARTTFKPNVDLSAETTFYWRVIAIDETNGVSSPASNAATFATTFAIDLRKAVFLHSPDASNWPQTGTLFSVEQDGAGQGPMCMAFSDPGWPDSPWPYGGPDPNFGVFANQWYFAKINGTWYGGAGEWIYRGAGSCKAGQGTRTIGPDSGFGPPFSSWVPKPGELVGYMVTSVARPGVKRTVDERTNIIVQPWHDSSLQGFPVAAFRR
jgi:hypothetical protein